jgi:hypothetical protein
MIDGQSLGGISKGAGGYTLSPGDATQNRVHESCCTRSAGVSSQVDTGIHSGMVRHAVETG